MTNLNFIKDFSITLLVFKGLFKNKTMLFQTSGRVNDSEGSGSNLLIEILLTP